MSKINYKVTVDISRASRPHDIYCTKILIASSLDQLAEKIYEFNSDIEFNNKMDPSVSVICNYSNVEKLQIIQTAPLDLAHILDYVAAKRNKFRQTPVELDIDTLANTKV